MVSTPSLLARLIEFITAVFGSFWGLWGTVTALLTLIGAVAWAFALDQAQTAMQQWLRSTQVRRLVVFAAISIFFFAAANFQAFDELNNKYREALTRLAVAEASQQQSRSRNERRSQMQTFYQQAVLLQQEITRSTFESLPGNLRQADHWRQEVSVWLKQNLGEAAQARFQDPAAVQAAARSVGVYDFSDGRLPVLIGFRDNLRAMIENEGWTKP